MEYQVTDNENMIAILLVVFLLAATAYGIAKGITLAVSQIRLIKSGYTLEEIRKLEKEKDLEKQVRERKKFESIPYRVMHPLEWINHIAFEKISGLIKKGRKNAKKTK